MILILTLPFALLSDLLPINEYIAQGLEDGIDCDGPISIFILAIPSFIVYGIGVCLYAFMYKKTKQSIYVFAVIVCCIVIVAMMPNLISAINEYSINNTMHIKTCG